MQPSTSPQARNDKLQERWLQQNAATILQTARLTSVNRGVLAHLLRLVLYRGQQRLVDKDGQLLLPGQPACVLRWKACVSRQEVATHMWSIDVFHMSVDHKVIAHRLGVALGCSNEQQLRQVLDAGRRSWKRWVDRPNTAREQAAALTSGEVRQQAMQAVDAAEQALLAGADTELSRCLRSVQQLLPTVPDEQDADTLQHQHDASSTDLQEQQPATKKAKHTEVAPHHPGADKEVIQQLQQKNQQLQQEIQRLQQENLQLKQCALRAALAST